MCYTHFGAPIDCKNWGGGGGGGGGGVGEERLVRIKVSALLSNYIYTTKNIFQTTIFLI